jgi:acyl-CoA synthetase (AMP-forming)/AMP-acid ligase II
MMPNTPQYPVAVATILRVGVVLAHQRNDSGAEAMLIIESFAATLSLCPIFAPTVGMMRSMRNGGQLVLIPNPRDLPAMLKTLSQHAIHRSPAVNTLFNALAQHPDFHLVDWRHLKVFLGGGSAVQRSVTQLWFEKTGGPIGEGYGLTETSPSVGCNLATAPSHGRLLAMPGGGGPGDDARGRLQVGDRQERRRLDRVTGADFLQGHRIP